MLNCQELNACMRLYRNSGSIKLAGIYRANIGKQDGQRVWIVNGDKIAREIYPEWIMGGNDERYKFNPDEEIWIDDRIGPEELAYTIAHEILERRLMREQGFSYNKAHNEALDLERKLRDKDEKSAQAHLSSVLRNAPCGSLLSRRLSQDKLARLYRMPFGGCRQARIWIVDGPLVRQTLAPNFCFSECGEDFIPQNEIWIDSCMNSLETYFASFRQKLRHKLLWQGHSQERSYEMSLVCELVERERQARLSLEHEKRLSPVSYGARGRGSGKGGGKTSSRFHRNEGRAQ